MKRLLITTHASRDPESLSDSAFGQLHSQKQVNLPFHNLCRKQGLIGLVHAAKSALKYGQNRHYVAVHGNEAQALKKVVEKNRNVSTEVVLKNEE